MRRPHTLSEIAAWSQTASDFSLHLRDFLHAFAGNPSASAWADEPELLAERFELGPVADAYLAAVAVTLAAQLELPPPAWSRAPQRYCERAWFASPGPAMRACLLLESPGPFRERNLFITSNALSVA
jgi:hypothetical protein